MRRCQGTIGYKPMILIATGALLLTVALTNGSQGQPVPDFSPIATVFVPILVNNHAAAPVPAAPAWTRTIRSFHCPDLRRSQACLDRCCPIDGDTVDRLGYCSRIVCELRP